MGWGAGLEILGPGILVPGVVDLAALMMALRIVFGVVAAVGECILWGDWDSELGARRLETRSGEPLTNGSWHLSLSWVSFSVVLPFCFPVSDGAFTRWRALLLRLSSFWTAAKRVASDVRMDEGRVGEGRDTWLADKTVRRSQLCLCAHSRDPAAVGGPSSLYQQSFGWPSSRRLYQTGIILGMRWACAVSLLGFPLFLPFGAVIGGRPRHSWRKALVGA